jgi:hypothetical protein
VASGARILTVSERTLSFGARILRLCLRACPEVAEGLTEPIARTGFCQVVRFRVRGGTVQAWGAETFVNKQTQSRAGQNEGQVLCG